MIRSLVAIGAAMQLVAPQFQPRDAAVMELRCLGFKHDLDPYTIVAVVERESQWDAGARGKKGEVGLGQLMPTNYMDCADGDLFAVPCRRKVELLLDWRENLKATAALMAATRTYCQVAVRSSLAVHWLQEYQGYAGTCGHRKDARGRWVALPIPGGTMRVLERRRELARRFP